MNIRNGVKGLEVMRAEERGEEGTHHQQQKARDGMA